MPSTTDFDRRPRAPDLERKVPHAPRPGATSTLVVVLLAMAGGCTFNHNLRITPKLDSLPASPPEPVTVGLYFSPEFSDATYSRLLGPHRWTFAIGRDSAATFDAVAARAFEKVVRIDALPPYATDAVPVDVIIEPELEAFHFKAGMERDSPEHAIRYRLHLYTKEGTPLETRSVTGKRVPTQPHFTVFAEVDEHMEDAAAKLLQEFHHLPDPAAAPKALAAPDPASAGLLVSVEPRRGPLRIRDALSLPLEQAGIIAVTVRVKNAGRRKVTVRESDMRLIVPGGRTLGTSGIAGIPSRLEERTYSGDAAAAFLGAPIGMLVMAAESSRRSEARAQLLAGLGPLVFGARDLGPGEEGSGLVFFIPANGMPPIASADLSLWAFEAEAGGALRLRAPVEGLGFTPRIDDRRAPSEPGAAE